MRHRHQFGIVDGVIVGVVADRAARRYGWTPTILVLLGLGAAYVHPLLGALYVALGVALIVLWALWRGFIFAVRNILQRRVGKAAK